MLEREKSALVVIDYQPKLLPKIFNAEAIIPQALLLIRVAKALQIPILLTEQYPKGLGPTVETLAAELQGIAPIAKTAFGCFGEPGFVSALKNTGRRHLLVMGIETHVCVMQTCLAALLEGYEVFLTVDACGSRRQTDHDAALNRMRRASVELVTAEMAIFECLRDAASPEFKQVLPLLK